MSTSSMQVNKTSFLAAIGAVVIAAFAAFAIAAPSNALANEATPSYNGDAVVYDLVDGTYNQQFDASAVGKDALIIQVSGNVTINGDLHANENITIRPKNSGNTAKLKIVGEVRSISGAVIFGEMLYDNYDNFSVTVSSSHEDAVNSYSGVMVLGSRVTATGVYCGVNTPNGTITNYGGSLTSTASKKSISAYGILANSLLMDTNSIFTRDPTVTGTSYGHGVVCNYEARVYDGTLKGTSTKSTKSTSNVCVGVSIMELMVAGGKVYGYASADSGSSTLTSSKIGAKGIGALIGLCQMNGGKLYASSKGKYGIGLYTAEILTYNSLGQRPVISAYAKDYGYGIAVEHLARFDHADVTSYGGKAAFKQLNKEQGLAFEDCVVKAYGKNTKGTRTGHGIYAYGYVAFDMGTTATVYAKKSTSYYGIRSVNEGIYAYNNSVVKTYAYKTKAYKVASGKKVLRDSTSKYYRNGSTYKATLDN